MEEGQHADQDVVRVDVDHLVDAADIGLDVAVGQDRALGVAGRAGGEHDADHVVGSVLMDAEEADQELCRHPEGLRGGNDFVAAGGGSPEILEVDELGVELQRHTLEEGPAGQDVADAGLRDRQVEQLRAERVVEVDDHPVVERQGEVGHDRRGRRRQQDADVLLIRREHRAAEQAAQDQRAGQHLPAGQGCAGGVGDLGRAQSPPAHRNRSRTKRR